MVNVPHTHTHRIKRFSELLSFGEKKKFRNKKKQIYTVKHTKMKSRKISQSKLILYDTRSLDIISQSYCHKLNGHYIKIYFEIRISNLKAGN